MPGMRCAVAACNNSYFKTKLRPDGVSYFRFPKDERLKKIWQERCKRKDSFNPATSYICSDHFKAEDFVKSIKAEILGSKKKMIDKCAMPSIKLFPNENEKKFERKDRRKEKERKEMVNSLLENDVTQKFERKTEKTTELNPSSLLCCEEVDVNYKLEYLKLKDSFERYQREQEDKMKKLEKENRSMKKEQENAVAKEVRNVLSGVFSQTQIDILLNKRKRVKAWSSEDITKAFTIRYLSKRCYIHLRTKMGIPLPCLTTLKQWAAKLNFYSGVLTKVISLLEVASTKMNTFEKLVVMQYDEMKIMSVYEYDVINDKVLGPHSQVQVVMIRSLFGSWKQPVFVDFDFKMTKACLEEITQRMFSIGLTVVAVVSDCAGGNVGLWKECNVSYNHSYMFSEITKKNIYFFADVPHLLKLIRNWFIDGGFTLPNGTLITPQPVQMLISSAKGMEISSCYKLTPMHINCEKFQRQNVRLAAQLMSNTTACALKRYDICDESLRIPAANFIKSTNDWFDVMNSRIPNASLSLQSGYGLHLEEQKKVLDSFIATMEEITCIKKDSKKRKNGKQNASEASGKKGKSYSKINDKKTLQLFQKGVIMSTKSLIGLFEDLKRNFKISYILTAKLNQDSLENFFSLVRGNGGANDHPSPLESLYRMRLIVLGKSDALRVNCNSHQTEEDFIVGKVLKALEVTGDQREELKPEDKTTCALGTTMTNNSDADEECFENEIELLSEDRVDESDLAWLNNNDFDIEFDNDTSLIGNINPQQHQTRYEEDKIASDGLQYISGWIAKKLKTKYPHLGNYTHENTRNEGSWVKELSAGGLTEPTIEFESTILGLENIFQNFIGERLSSCSGIRKELSKKLKIESPGTPDEIIELFARRRIVMRVKFLNKQLSESNKTKKTKKLKKVTT